MEYQLKRSSRSRSIRIRVDTAGGVVVSAPRFVARVEIERFLVQTTGWIERQRRKITLQQTANPTINWDEDIISYLGKLYYIRFQSGEEKVSFTGGVCRVSPVTGLAADVKRTLLKWLKTHAEGELLHRTTTWAERMQTRFGTIRFGQQTSRWGSCTPDNNLRFNWRLIHFPPEVIDYVVIHELAHTIHHDHSGRFWQLVERYCPGYKEQRKFLKRQVVTVEK